VFRPTADGVLVLAIQDGYGNWGFPKGHIEPGEENVEAAVREIAEETGIDGLTLLERLGSIDWRFRADGATIHKYCHFHLFQAEGGEPKPQAEEGIQKAEWIPLDRAEELISYANARRVLQRASRLFDAEVSRGEPRGR
jgi:8-oxo-dGTP pyrophosphatase MutT (NUDIX family)